MLLIVFVFVLNPLGSFATNSHSVDLEKGSSQWLSRPENAELSITGDMSAEIMVKVESVPGTSTQYGFIDKGQLSGGQASYSFYYQQNGADVKSLRVAISSDGGTVNQSVDLVNFTLTTGTWFRIGFSYDASAGEIIFYVNGVKEGATQTGAETSIFDSTTDLNVGAIHAGTDSFFDGLVDDVRVWDDIRTSTEMADNDDCELGSSQDNLVGYWKLDNDLTDSSVNSNTLTNNNSAVFSTDVNFTASCEQRRVIITQ